MQIVAKRTIRWLARHTAVGRKALAALDIWPYLEEKGWLRSFQERMPVDRDGNCLPWYSYSMVTFLSDRVGPDMRVFEYGSGYSTLWWAERVSHVTSCEHDREWYDSLKARAPANVDLRFCGPDTDCAYSLMAAHFEDEFHCLVIDGRDGDRVDCAKNCLRALKDDGVIIWDNSERERYAEGYAFLQENGFRRLDFWGLMAILPVESCTSVFYRERNCLGI